MINFTQWQKQKLNEDVDLAGPLTATSSMVSIKKLPSSLRKVLVKLKDSVDREGGVDNKRAFLVQAIEDAGYQDEGVKSALQQLKDDFRWILSHLKQDNFTDEELNTEEPK